MHPLKKYNRIVCRNTKFYCCKKSTTCITNDLTISLVLR